MHGAQRRSWRCDVLRVDVCELLSIIGRKATNGPIGRLTQMATSGIATSGVIVLATDAFEGGSLVDGDRARAVLVFGVGIVDGRAKGGEMVGSYARLKL